LEQTFFGFNLIDRVALHESMFNLVWFGQGRWSWGDIYSMPVFLRRFWISKIRKMEDEAMAASEVRNQKAKPHQKPKVVKPPM